MTIEEYGKSYERGFRLTVRFLGSRGLCSDAAEETAQAAWVKGLEHLGQLRNKQMVVTWVNSIALNVYRSFKRAPVLQQLPELTVSPQVNLAAIDVQRLFRFCKTGERFMFRLRYLEGFGIRDIAQQEGCSESAVRLRLLRARRSARVLLGEAA